jgi:hypothetical protein
MQMTDSELRVRKLIQAIEPKYEKLWDTISAIKKLAMSDGMIHFQYNLACCLFMIKEEYIKIKRERSAFLNSGIAISYQQKQDRLKEFEKCLDALKNLIYIGKSMGDAFAWFFYQNDRGMLNEHIAAEETLFAPGEIGSRGELEFTNKFKLFNGYLVLHHGITNILRIGDASLIDSKTVSLAGLVELKSKKEGENLVLTMHAFGYKSKEFDKQMNIGKNNVLIPSQNIQNEQEEDVYQKRLNKQIATMLKSLDAAEEEAKTDKKKIGSYSKNNKYQ